MAEQRYNYQSDSITWQMEASTEGSLACLAIIPLYTYKVFPLYQDVSEFLQAHLSFGIQTHSN